jgi:arylsulfatase A-like enzyme
MKPPSSLSVVVTLLLCGSATFLASCSEDSSRPNLLLISIDTLRPDHLGCYGYARPTSPAIDELAAEGAMFLAASSTSPWTLPSHASLLTGLYPSRHGVKNYDVRLSFTVESLATRLTRSGYQSMAVINSHNLSERYGLDQGFESFNYVSEWDNEKSRARRLTNKGNELADRALQWIDARDERPFFLFLHSYDVHTDFAAKKRYVKMFAGAYGGRFNGSTNQLVDVRNKKLALAASDSEHLVDLYDAEIRQMDEMIKRILDYLEQSGLAKNTYVVLVSDHGEEFMEHGSVLHGRTYFEEVIRIPMLIRGPGVPAGERIDEPVSLVDITPTVLSLLGLSEDPSLDGADLSPFWRDPSNAPRGRFLFAEADHRIQVNGKARDDIIRMVRVGQHKLIYDRAREQKALYDLAVDPNETSDLSQANGSRTRALMERIRAFLETERTGDHIGPPSEADQALLRELGYGV